MSFDCLQLKEYIIRPALNAIGLMSDDALYLLLGTCAQESKLGTFLVQGRTLDAQDALGIYQQERSGYDRIWTHYISNNPALRAKIRLYLGYEGKPAFARLISDHALSTIICRLYYLTIKEPLPSYKNLEDMARYYKKYYNGPGKATEKQFMDNYLRYVK